MGVYVDMVRQQHAQRAHLVARGACQFWRESEAQTDCAQCRKLSYITVAIDNQISAVSLALIRRSTIVMTLLYLPSAYYSITMFPVANYSQPQSCCSHCLRPVLHEPGLGILGTLKLSTSRWA